jgi:hypothetical protein
VNGGSAIVGSESGLKLTHYPFSVRPTRLRMSETILAESCVVTPPMLTTTAASPLLMLKGTMTLSWTSPATTIPAKATPAGCPPMVTVAVLAMMLAPEKTWLEGTDGLPGPKPVPHRMIVSPGLAREAGQDG